MACRRRCSRIGRHFPGRIQDFRVSTEWEFTRKFAPEGPRGLQHAGIHSGGGRDLTPIKPSPSTSSTSNAPLAPSRTTCLARTPTSPTPSPLSVAPLPTLHVLYCLFQYFHGTAVHKLVYHSGVTKGHTLARYVDLTGVAILAIAGQLLGTSSRSYVAPPFGASRPQAQAAMLRRPFQHRG